MHYESADLDVLKQESDYCLLQRLASFFEEARPLVSDGKRVNVPHLGIDRARLERFVEDLRAPLDSASAAACENPWGTAGLGHDEVRASAVLAALWDRRRHGDEARAFLARFFARAGPGFPNEAELADGYRVHTEHCLNGAVADRVDITVETRSSMIGIEVKIRSGEGTNQLARYVAAIATRAQLMHRAKHGVIFLAPYLAKCENVSVPSVSWRCLGDLALEANQSSISGWLIAEFGRYCRSLGD